MLWIVVVIAVTWILANRWLRSLRVGSYGKKFVLVTGCDSGFGRELTIQLDGLGFHVFAGCLTEDGKQSLQQLCSKNVQAFQMNVTQKESIQQALNLVKENLPDGSGLWALVNNAGISGTAAAAEMCTKKDFVEAMEVNLLAPMEISRTFLPLLRKEKGRVVSITSVMGRLAAVSAPYCVSKFGLEAYLDVLRREVYTQGIKISILEPGFFPTNIMNTQKIVETTRMAFERSSDDLKSVYGRDYCEQIETLTSSLSLASSVQWVCDAYVHALTARFPLTRYVVGWDAKLVFIPLTYLPDWLTDWLLYRHKQHMLKAKPPKHR